MDAKRYVVSAAPFSVSIKLESLELGVSQPANHHSHGKFISALGALGYLSFSFSSRGVCVPTPHNLLSLSFLSSHETVGPSGLEERVSPLSFLHT